MTEAVIEGEPIDYNSMTKTQLQDLLTEMGVEWTTGMLKAELVSLAELISLAEGSE